MLFNLLEKVESRPKEIDPQGHVLRGVKLVGLSSLRKNRRYSPEGLKRAVEKYRGKPVNIDHSPNNERSVSDRIGRIEHAEFREGKGIFGDVRLNPAHPLTQQVLWWAMNDPQGIGFSHAVQGRGTSSGGETLIEEIERVMSVDLVADPATTSGLFESESAEDMELPAEESDVARLERIFGPEEWTESGVGLLAESWYEERPEHHETDVGKLERLYREPMKG